MQQIPSQRCTVRVSHEGLCVIVVRDSVTGGKLLQKLIPATVSDLIYWIFVL